MKSSHMRFKSFKKQVAIWLRLLNVLDNNLIIAKVLLPHEMYVFSLFSFLPAFFWLLLGGRILGIVKWFRFPHFFFFPLLPSFVHRHRRIPHHTHTYNILTIHTRYSLAIYFPRIPIGHTHSFLFPLDMTEYTSQLGIHTLFSFFVWTYVVMQIYRLELKYINILWDFGFLLLILMLEDCWDCWGEVSVYIIYYPESHCRPVTYIDFMVVLAAPMMCME